MIVSGYLLDLYCDNPDSDVHRHGYYDIASDYTQFPFSYTADGKGCYSEVRRLAKKDGWKFNRDGTVLCPKCAKTTLKNKTI